jgi:hypothetical protein
MTQSGIRQASASQSYSTLSEFYNDDHRRVRSSERDIGLWWRDDPGGPLHRAAWVSETGELYLVRLGSPERGGGAVEVLAQVGDRDRLERALRGWRERCGENRSLGWLRAQAACLDERSEAALDARRQPGRPLVSAGAGAGTTLAATSALVSELARHSRPRKRVERRPMRLSSRRLAPSASPAK